MVKEKSRILSYEVIIMYSIILTGLGMLTYFIAQQPRCVWTILFKYLCVCWSDLTCFFSARPLEAKLSLRFVKNWLQG